MQLPADATPINFNDFEPGTSSLPIHCEHFHVEKLAGNFSGKCDGSSFHVLAGIAGALAVNGEPLRVGEFALLPAALGDYGVTGDGAVLRVSVPL